MLALIPRRPWEVKNCLLAGHLSLPVWLAMLFLSCLFTDTVMPWHKEALQSPQQPRAGALMCPFGQTFAALSLTVPWPSAQGSAYAPNQPISPGQRFVLFATKSAQDLRVGLAQCPFLLRWMICSSSLNPSSGPLGVKVFVSQAPALMLRRPEFTSLLLFKLASCFCVPRFPQAVTWMAALHCVPEARRENHLQRVTIQKCTYAFWRWGFHNSSLPCWGICSGSLHEGEIPSPPGLLGSHPGRALLGDELLKWEGSGALSVCVECV